jgi:hypothetical protein
VPATAEIALEQDSFRPAPPVESPPYAVCVPRHGLRHRRSSQGGHCVGAYTVWCVEQHEMPASMGVLGPFQRSRAPSGARRTLHRMLGRDHPRKSLVAPVG